MVRQVRVPLVDIRPAMSRVATVKEIAPIAHEILHYSSTIGTFSVNPGHANISKQLLDDIYGHTKEFHSLSAETKKRYHFSKSPQSRGWVPLFEEPSYEKGTKSFVEAFDLARDLPACHPAVQHGVPQIGPNVWVPEIKNFQRDVTRYYDATTELARAIFRIIAVLLRQAPNYFDDKSTELARSTLRLLQYPGSNAVLHENDRGISAHTDFECFTFIHQNAPGLQIQHNGEWVQPDTLDHFTVLLGDVIEILSNGSVLATPHRVLVNTWPRQSIIRFNGLDGHRVCQPLPEFVGAAGVKYAATTQAEHLANQVQLAQSNNTAQNTPKISAV